MCVDVVFCGVARWGEDSAQKTCGPRDGPHVDRSQHYKYSKKKQTNFSNKIKFRAKAFARLDKKDQMKMIQAVRTFLLKSESLYPLYGADAKKVAFYNFINEARAQGPDDDVVYGSDVIPQCAFAGWLSIVKNHPVTGRPSCRHPDLAGPDEDTLGYSPKSCGSEKGDGKTGQILCQPFLAGENPDAPICVPYINATQNCIDKDPTGEKALAYAKEYPEEFHAYVATMKEEYCGKGIDNLDRLRARGTSVKADQVNTCAALIAQLDKIDNLMKADIEKQDLENAKKHTGEGKLRICSYSDGGSQYEVWQDKGIIAVLEDGKVYYEGKLVEKVDSENKRIIKIKSTLGILNFEESGKSQCDAVYLSLEAKYEHPEGGKPTCSWKTPGKYTEGRKTWAKVEMADNNTTLIASGINGELSIMEYPQRYLSFDSNDQDSSENGSRMKVFANFKFNPDANTDNEKCKLEFSIDKPTSAAVPATDQTVPAGR